jgi:integrase
LVEFVKQDYELNDRKSADTIEYRVKHFSQFFGLDRVVDISEARIERFKLLRREAGAANASINRELSVLRRGPNLAVRQRLITSAPRIETLKERNVREGFCSKEQIDAIASRLPRGVDDLIRYLFLSAWRRGEASGLMWSDVDREEKVVRLRAANSKNSYGRILPIEGELAEIIERRWQARKMTQSDGAILLARHVFYRGKDKPIRDVRDVWKKACAEVGLLDLLVHDLRRSGIRNMTRAGVPESVAMRISGHCSKATFLRYDICAEEDIRDAVRRTQAYLKQQGKKGRRDQA